MATIGYNALTKELCRHVSDVLAEALAGDQEARRWIMGGFGQSHGIFLQDAWSEADAKAEVWPASNADRLRQRRQRLGELAQATMQQLGRLQAEARDIDETLHQMQIAPLASELIAKKQEWLHQQAAEEKQAAAERFAEDLRKQQEAAQRQRDYEAAVAYQHRERAVREAEAAEAKRRQLVRDGFMPA